MSMRVTTYAYPWDLARLGVERALREIDSVGIEAIDLAATYHPIDALSPRDGARLFTSPRGAVHFPARRARYGRIQPSLSRDDVCAVWPEVARSAADLGLAVNAWIVTLFQPWMIDAYPECARVLPSGDRSGSGVCPANEDVREYFAVLCDDIVDQFDISLIRLEGIITRTYDFDWLRPRVIVNVPPVARELLAVCFCASCTTRAAAEGLDVHRLSGLVNGAIAAELGDGTDSTDAETAANAAADPELRAFLVQQVRSSTDFVRAAVSRIDVGRIPRTSTTASTPFPALLGAVEEGLLEELVDVIDQVAMFPGNVEHNRRVAAIAARTTPPRELAMLSARLRPGSSTPTPVAHAGADLAAPELQEAAELGVAELGLYNYGLLRERDVREFVAAVRTAFP
jgi:hypothetical protein